MTPSALRVLVASALLSACIVQPDQSRPPPTGGDGVAVDGSKVSIDATKVPVVGQCQDGQVVRRTASGWECAEIAAGGIDAAKTPVLTSCGEGQFIRKTTSGWECAAVETGGVDPSKTPVVTACAEGQVVKKTATGWECSAGTGDSNSQTLVTQDVADGMCIVLNHGWNTNSIGYSVWMYRPALHAWAPWPRQGDHFLTKSVSADIDVTAVSSGQATPQNPQTLNWSAAAGMTTGTMTIDLGAPQDVARISFWPASATTWLAESAVTSWELESSVDGQAFSSTATGMVQWNANISPPQWRDTKLSDGMPVGLGFDGTVYARYLRLRANATTAAPGSTAQPTAAFRNVSVEVYRHTVLQPDTNSLRFCNTTGFVQTIALTAWR